VTQEDRAVYQALSLRFQGRNEWVFFSSMEPGYLPWNIDSSQADLLLQALQNFAAALAHLDGRKVKVDFDGGGTLMRFYSAEDELWHSEVMKMPPKLV